MGWGGYWRADRETWRRKATILVLWTANFKAPYTVSSAATIEPGPRQTETQQVSEICAEIERLALELGLFPDNEDKPKIIEKGDIISLEEAKRNTGVLEHLGHSIKKLVWA